MTCTIIGDALIDIVVPVHDFTVGETYNEKIIVAGGGAGNMALQVSRLREKVLFFGTVGNDTWGQYYRDFLKGENIVENLTIDNEHTTGICVSFVNREGERTMIVDRGANDFLTSEHIDAHLPEILSSNALVLSGYSFQSTNNVHILMNLLNEVKRSDCQIMFNPGAPNISSDETVQFIKNFVDVLILNYQESCALTNETEISRIIEKISNCCDCSIITLGKKGSLAVTNDDVLFQDCDPIQVFDTTGAGDSFMAGFIVSKSRGYYLQDSIKFSNTVAKKFLMQKNERYL